MLNNVYVINKIALNDQKTYVVLKETGSVA